MTENYEERLKVVYGREDQLRKLYIQFALGISASSWVILTAAAISKPKIVLVPSLIAITFSIFSLALSFFKTHFNAKHFRSVYVDTKDGDQVKFDKKTEFKERSDWIEKVEVYVILIAAVALIFGAAASVFISVLEPVKFLPTKTLINGVQGQVGPVGEKGPPGDKGPIGEKGPSGKSLK